MSVESDSIRLLVEQVDRLAERIKALHTPVEEEAECWGDGDEDMQRDHAERFPHCDPTGCDGHTYRLMVCTECGYTNHSDVDGVWFRPWPCPTLRAFEDMGRAIVEAAAA